MHACHVSSCRVYNETAPAMKLYSTRLILCLGVVRELSRPVIGNLLSGGYPNGARRLGGEVVHELRLCEQCERPASSDQTYLGQCGKPTGFTNDSTVQTDRLRDISLIVWVR